MITNEELAAIQKRYDETLNGFSSDPGTYLDSSRDVPKLLEALDEAIKERNEAIVSALYWKGALNDLEKYLGKASE